MKFLIVVSLTIFSLGAFAEELSEMKEMANSKIDGELSSLNKSRTCVKNASTMDAFKACNVDVSDIKMQREEEKKEGMKEEAKEEYEETKEKLDDAM